MDPKGSIDWMLCQVKFETVTTDLIDRQSNLLADFQSKIASSLCHWTRKMCHICTEWQRRIDQLGRDTDSYGPVASCRNIDLTLTLLRK